MKNHKKKKFQLNYHFVFIEVPFEFVAPEVMLWGEAQWWPKDFPVQYVRETQGEIQVGTCYKQKILKPVGLSWTVEVTKFVPNRLIERTFQKGILEGYEIVKVEERSNGARIDYELHYSLKGLINKILWPLVFEKHHDKNIEHLLLSLKNYMTQKFEKKLDEGV